MFITSHKVQKSDEEDSIMVSGEREIRRATCEKIIENVLSCFLLFVINHHAAVLFYS